MLVLMTKRQCLFITHKVKRAVPYRMVQNSFDAGLGFVKARKKT